MPKYTYFTETCDDANSQRRLEVFLNDKCRIVIGIEDTEEQMYSTNFSLSIEDAEDFLDQLKDEIAYAKSIKQTNG